MGKLDLTIKEQLQTKISELEKLFNSDVTFFYGPIGNGVIKPYRDFIELLKKDSDSKTLTVILNTPGGSVETVEKLVEIIRYHYNYLNLIVPDFAFSAGTIWCMAADKIFMDYSSSLGPIDPQVYNGKEWVPALGYLDQVEKLIDKAKKNELTDAEFAILQSQDLAKLTIFEQAKNLTITLLKEWLVKYKFKDWATHSSTSKPVTSDDKKKRAENVAKLLGDNKLWHSHGRMIGIDKLESILRLKIENYSNNDEMRDLIRSYNDLITEYIMRNNFQYFLHSKLYF